jgi:hypothetical protein
MHSGGILVGIGLIVAAILTFVFVSGFSVGSITETASNPFGPGEGPPLILMSYEGNEYEGQLLGYTYDNLQTISELPDPNLANITSVSTDDSVNITRGSSVEFLVEGNPAPEARFDSLAVTAYTPAGDPVRLLDANDDPPRNSYVIDDLESGEYVLLSTATWKPDTDTERVSGYVVYGHRIYVVNQ